MAAKKKADETGATLGERVLQVGDSGDDVKVVQELVLVESSGEFDAATEKAVKVWQMAHSLNRTGIVDPATARAMTRAMDEAKQPADA